MVVKHVRQRDRFNIYGGSPGRSEQNKVQSTPSPSGLGQKVPPPPNTHIYLPENNYLYFYLTIIRQLSAGYVWVVLGK